MGVTIWLGNSQAVNHLVVGATPEGAEIRQRVLDPTGTVTTIHGRDDATTQDLMREVTNHLWPHMSDAPSPTWVASTDPNLSRRLGAFYDCEIRDPEAEHGPH